jgi:hypothetical protein
MATKGRAEDIKVLRALIKSDEVGEDESRIFADMYDKLERRKGSCLSSPQREWAERVYYRLGLDREEPAENLVSTGKVKVTAKEREDLHKFLESLGPRPVKPPVRARQDD